MLFNEPKLLKYAGCPTIPRGCPTRFSALQRAEIAEIRLRNRLAIAREGFSALQRAEIAEIAVSPSAGARSSVSVLFNEPKLLK